MPHELPKYLYDVRQACAALEEFIQGKTFDQYLKDHMLQAAVERKLTIIGEALLKAVKIDPTLDQSVKDLSQIIVTLNKAVVGSFPTANVTGRIVVHGLSGNDTIGVSTKPL